MEPYISWSALGNTKEYPMTNVTIATTGPQRPAPIVAAIYKSSDDGFPFAAMVLKPEWQLRIYFVP